MRAAWVVARREYAARVRSPWFSATTLGVPILLFLLIALGVFASLGSDRVEPPGEATLDLFVEDGTGVLIAPLTPRLRELGFRLLPLSPDLRSDGKTEEERVASLGRTATLLLLDQRTLSNGTARMLTSAPIDSSHRTALELAILTSVVELRSVDAPDVSSIVTGGTLVVEEVDSGVDGPPPSVGSGNRSGPNVALVYAGVFLMYFVTLAYAVTVMRSVLEEKSNRIVEVLLSAVDPWHLLLGKVVGVGAVGLTQLAVWAFVGVAVFLSGTVGIPAATGQAGAMPDRGLVVLFLVFFVGGYFLFAAMYASVGAMCTSEREASQAAIPVVLVIAAPVALLPPVLAEPTSTMSVGLSLVPFFVPTLMFARAGVMAVPPWQLILGVVLVACSIVGTAWIAGRIYRAGILMTGKRVTVREAWRALREGGS